MASDPRYAVLWAAINELRELRSELLEKGLPTDRVTADIVRLVNRINDMTKKDFE